MRMARRYREQGRPAPPEELLAANGKTITELDLRMRRIMAGGPIGYDPQVVRRVNALQMTYASRFVISSKRDFSLPQEMIGQDEAYRRGVTIGEYVVRGGRPTA